MSSEQACPGTCNRHYREAQEAFKQALADYDPLDADQSRPEPPSIQPWPGDPWCSRCKSKIRETLAELDYLAGILAATADGHRTGVDNERVSGTAAPMSPSQAGDDLDELASMLKGWEDAYRELRDWQFAPRRGSLASPETETINWLMRHLDEILAAPFAIDFGTEILLWHREFKNKSKAGVRSLRKPMRCHSCGYLLAWVEGDSYVSCGNCHIHVPLAEYEAEVARLGGALERGELDAEIA
jgi:LSD1 subclass zinc finger protein